MFIARFYLFISLFFYATISSGMESSKEAIEALKTELRACSWNNEIFMIIDMQPGFPAAEDVELQARIIAELEAAMKKNQLVIFIEYGINSPTFPSISQAVGNYPLVYTLYKHKNSAYDQIEKFLGNFSDDTYTFNICGIETAACVYQTVIDLCENEPNYRVIVLKDCCGSAFKEQHDEALATLRYRRDELSNLLISDEMNAPVVAHQGKQKPPRTWKFRNWLRSLYSTK